MRNKLKGQSVVEYFIMFVIILAVMFSSGIIGRIQKAFVGYFDKAASYMQ